MAVENECDTIRQDLSEISDLSCSQSFQARLHGAILTPLVMEARPAVHQGGDGVPLSFYLQFKIVVFVIFTTRRTWAPVRIRRSGIFTPEFKKIHTFGNSTSASRDFFGFPSIFLDLAEPMENNRYPSIWVPQEPCQSTCTTSHSRGDEEASSAANCASLTTETSPPASALFG